MERLWFTGVPGSQWSGIYAQTQKRLGFIDNSDRESLPTFTTASGHVSHSGAYFDPGMQFGSDWDNFKDLSKDQILEEVDKPWTGKGTKVIKFHELGVYENLQHVLTNFPKDNIMFVYKDDDASLDWWLRCGGFDITYPSYTWYKNESTMLERIKIQNQGILKFVKEHDIKLEPFTNEWLLNNIPTASEYLIEKHHDAFKEFPEVTVGLYIPK
ncbi:MAG: hypothetical protein CBD16_02085 [Betaproteobacteria bacterium TMED156]|nr:MAG: hypothetical protein CBD16_02085 [Betaproteobacteria bacterium TMED156]|tara:strand:- start:11922 stop:12560 length:639 start_codon:yes stop_codon:yes gene_type:complete